MPSRMNELDRPIADLGRVSSCRAAASQNRTFPTARSIFELMKVPYAGPACVSAPSGPTTSSPMTSSRIGPLTGGSIEL